jgi:hypothetical protein
VKAVAERSVLSAGEGQSGCEVVAKPLGFDHGIDDKLGCQPQKATSAANSARRSSMNCSRSSGSSMAAILLESTALIVASGPITAMRADGRAMHASGANPGSRE